MAAQDCGDSTELGTLATVPGVGSKSLTDLENFCSAISEQPSMHKAWHSHGSQIRSGFKRTIHFLFVSLSGQWPSVSTMLLIPSHSSALFQRDIVSENLLAQAQKHKYPTVTVDDVNWTWTFSLGVSDWGRIWLLVVFQFKSHRVRYLLLSIPFTNMHEVLVPCTSSKQCPTAASLIHS